MIDYHLHLWPHGTKPVEPTLERVAAYCERAGKAGVDEVALTEHLFRFRQADALLGGFWSSEPEPHLAAAMAAYWQEHQAADLDEYVSVAVAARQAGLPVVVGLEVDYYPGRMGDVAAMLSGYPFDVLLGSVHWLGAWLFDAIEDPVSQAEWGRRGTERAWREYTDALVELAGTGTCDVLAHPDLAKVAGHRPGAIEEHWDRMAEAAASSGMAAEVSSAGWRKPVGEAYPAPGLLDRFRARDVEVTTASDAHGLADVAHRSADLRELLRAAGYDRLATFHERRRVLVPLAGAAGAATGARSSRPGQEG